MTWPSPVHLVWLGVGLVLGWTAAMAVVLWVQERARRRYGWENRGQTLTITGGMGTGQWRSILREADGTITVDRAWTQPPDSTSEFTVRKV